ncbi:echinoderm microtubule-associated protein-like 6 isoform X1 [Hydra vulgaris]|uniref:echinoderm microtubule-associated protein-like 6 isoform X1 n=1 Tax=Hydra vulgaris TaxID=6087 RepID=UPI000640E62B|nr:echinoderm microtubule-associated protein-like 6 [Hydra vulgaris]
MVDKTPPPVKLRLEYVYGYRGHQCRNNLYYTNSGEIIYFVAGVGIVFDPKLKKQRFFLGHNDDIVSLALHPDGKSVATGQVGKEPYICIWDVSSCCTISILKDNHQNGIACLAFNTAGTQLASVGLEEYSQLTIWDWKKGKVISTTKAHNERIFDVCFNPYEDKKLVTSGVKHLNFWTLSGNSVIPIKGVFGDKGDLQSILCICFGTGGFMYSGTLSGDIYKWKDNILIENIVSAHSGAVLTLYTSADGFASGSKDGTIGLWDIEFKPITRIDLNQHALGYRGISVRSVCWIGEKILLGTNNGEVLEVSAADKNKPMTITVGHAEGELWGLAVHPKKLVFATGSDDMTVRLWDMSNKEMIAKAVFDVTTRSLAFSPDGSHLSIGHGDGSFRVLKGRELSELFHIHDRKDVLHEMRYSPDGAFLAVGCNDSFVDIYSVRDRYKRIGQCKGSTSNITHIDWSEDSNYLQTNSASSERFFFKIPGKIVTNTDEIEAIHWKSWTSVLGPEVNGIWEKYCDTTDINATDTNFQLGLIATGDDFGLVKLFRFPCINKGAKFRKYVGHSAHVTNVRFSYDGLYLVSTGGADHAIFQWRVVSEGYKEDNFNFEMVSDGLYYDSNDEASDSDLSDINPIDSDIEQEISIDYDRQIYKEDLPKIQRELKLSTESKQPRPSPPAKSIKLNHVFGYRGYDCRNNLFYTQSNEVVYHIAAVGIVINPITNNQRFYLGHDDDILCLTLHPIKDYVATGQIGRDPTIHIWDIETMNVLSILARHHIRGVCALDFSADGKKLASIGLDEDHSIVIWDWRRGEKLSIASVHKDKIFEVRWDSNNSDKLVTVGIRHIKFWTQTGGGLIHKRGIYGKVAKPDTHLCVTYSKSPGIIVSGGLSGLIYVWNEELLKSTVQAHQGPVFAIQALEKGFVSGGKDGLVCLWDDVMSRCLKSYKVNKANLASGQSKDVLVYDNPPIRAVTLGQGKILIGTKNGEILEIDKAGPLTSLVQGHCEGELWGLAQHPSENFCATIGDDKCLRIWDISKYQLFKLKIFEKSGRCATYSPDGRALAVGFVDGSFTVMNSNTLADICNFHHRKEEISDIKFSPEEGKYLAVASHDGFVDIYNVFSTKRVGICKGSSSYITHIDWDTRGKLIQVNNGAKEVLYFEAPRGVRQAIPSLQLDNLKWFSWTCVLGRECQGIWAPHFDVSDINAAHLSSDGTLLAIGDDYGFLKLYDFPCTGKNARCKKFNGHSADVCNVRWTHDSSFLLSVGGADTSLMVWKSLDAIEACTQNALESDSDSEFESGYDSDVEREKNIDYLSKIYTNPLRESSGNKPQLKEVPNEEKKKVNRGESEKTVIPKKDKNAAPIDDLILEFVYGYRGFDSRNNLHYLTDGSVVYPAAGTCVVFNLNESKQSFYVEHTDDVICLTINRNPKFKDVIASGQIGVSPSVHIWEAGTQKTLSVLQGYHTKGICGVNFSSSGRYLLTIGLDNDHSLAVWKWIDGTKVACGSGSNHRIFVGEFRPDSDTTFVTCGIKHVTWWNVTGGSLVAKKGNLSSYAGEAVNQTMLSVAYGPNDATFTGAISGDVYIWSVNLLTRIVKNVHSGPIFCMFTTVTDGLIVTGGKDKADQNSSAVKLWDQEMKRCKPFKLNQVVRSVFRGTKKGTILVGTQDNCIFEINEKTGSLQTLMDGHGDGELWGLSCHPSKDVFVTSSDDKTVRIWDIKSKSLLNKVETSVAARCCCFSPDGNNIAVGTANGEFYILDTNSLQIITKKRDRNKSITQIRYSQDGLILAVGSEDNSLDFYSIKPTFTRTGYCKNLSSSVVQLDLSVDGKYAQVCTGSYEHLVFSVPDGTQITDEIEINRMIWISWTCILGCNVIGIWPKNSDNGDINCAHLSHSGKTLASGDDFGFVKLFDFPVLQKYTKGKEFFGHSAHVTNIRFTHDDKYLVSTGGDDSCVFVWRCHQC